MPPPPANAIAAGVALAAAPPFITQVDASRALQAFRTSCPVLMRRQDQSGPDQRAQPGPRSAPRRQTVAPADAAAFFRDRFDWVSVGAGKAFATGYYEPEIAGSRTPLPGYVPIHGVPTDLTRCTRPDGQTGRGRVDETGICVLYHTRAEIEDGALANKAPILAYAADPIELFFLQIQGSGRVRFPDGSVMRIGYADQNGREYVAIGRLLRERGILPPGGANMQAIKAWMRANPDQGRELMRENLSYIFFTRADRAGAARRAQRARHAARDRRGRPEVRSAWRAGLPRARPARGLRLLGRAGHGRRDQGREPLRHLLGRTGPRRRRSPAACPPTGSR